jgi:hypothetical protein
MVGQCVGQTNADGFLPIASRQLGFTAATAARNRLLGKEICGSWKPICGFSQAFIGTTASTASVDYSQDQIIISGC